MTAELTGTEAKLLKARDALEPGTLRYEVVDAALSFKSSWIHLAEQLIRVKDKRAFKEWGYRRFQDFCQSELHIRSQTASKLLMSHRWLSHATDYSTHMEEEFDASTRELPKAALPESQPLKPIDFDAVNVAMQAERALSRDRLSEQDYASIKEATLQGTPAAELKRTLREHLKPIEVPEALKLERAYRKALDHCLKSLDALMSIDAEDTMLASGDAFRKIIVEALDAIAESQAELPPSDDDTST